MMDLGMVIYVWIVMNWIIIIKIDGDDNTYDFIDFDLIF
jgi:hypothetical protein